MKILDKYLLRQFIVPLIFCLSCFILTYIVIDLFDNLNEMIENDVNLRVIFPYYLNFIPLIFVQMSPVAILISLMFSLGRFNKNNEILAMQASGISLFRILRPLLATGLLMSIAVFLVNDRVVPVTTMNSVVIKERFIETAKISKKKAKGKKKIIENIAFYGLGNRIIYARRYDVYNNIIYEFIMHAQDSRHNIVSKTTAAEVKWENKQWVGSQVTFYKLDATGHIEGEPVFYDSGVIDIEETPLDFKKRRHQAVFMNFEFMSFEELHDYIERLSFERGPTVRNLKVALNQKIAFPFINLIVILIASPFALIHTRRGGVLVGIGISIGLVLAYYALMVIGLALGKAGFITPPLSAWLSNIIFAGIGILLILRHR